VTKKGVNDQPGVSDERVQRGGTSTASSDPGADQGAELVQSSGGRVGQATFEVVHSLARASGESNG
jgi:hypothetical protein